MYRYKCIRYLCSAWVKNILPDQQVFESISQKYALVTEESLIAAPMRFHWMGFPAALMNGTHGYLGHSSEKIQII